MKIVALIVGALALTAASTASAGLAGSAASEVYDYPALGTPYPNATYTPASFVIGAGQESSVDVEGVTTIAVDFGDSALDLVFNTTLTNPTWNSVSFNGLVFSGTGLGTIHGVTVLPSTTFAGFDASRATLSGDMLQLNWSGLSYRDGTRLDLAFNFGTVPEPASWALMVTGFGLAGVAMRRRARVAA